MDETRFVQITREPSIAEREFYPAVNWMFEQLWQQLLPAQILTDALSPFASRNLVTPKDMPVPDCVTCGACCVSMLCVGVRRDDRVAEDDYWNIAIGTEEGGLTVDRYMRRSPKTFKCVALSIETDGRAVCRIYNDRPRMCRDFEAGSDKCHALRRAFGHEPFLTLDEMSEALEKIGRRDASSDGMPDIIRFVRFIETGEGDFEIRATMKSGRIETVSRFAPSGKTPMQFEFDGLTLTQAEALVAARSSPVE